MNTYEQRNTPFKSTFILALTWLTKEPKRVAQLEIF